MYELIILAFENLGSSIILRSIVINSICINTEVMELSVWNHAMFVLIYCTLNLIPMVSLDILLEHPLK